MHRALLLPEIVSAILQAGKSEPGLLSHSLLVNQLWFQEASRILWAICNSTCTEQTHPDIHRLGTLVLLEGAERAQVYADVVQELSFHYGEDYTDQTSWHEVLCRLRFPMLRSVWFWETDHAALLNTENVILHYAQSALQALVVDACGTLSENFFDVLAQFCSRMQNLKLHPTKVDASPLSVLRLCQRLVNVVDLDLGEGFQKTLTLPLFEALASCRNLELLTIPHVQDDFLRSLEPASGLDWFPKLKYLCTSADASALELLNPFIPKLEALQLSNTHLGRTDNILSVVSSFTYLTDITLRLSASSLVRSEQTLQLAQRCPGLERLKIGDDTWSDAKPSAAGFTDSFIQELAPKLPRLKQLFFVLSRDSEDLPGAIKTIQTLGRHCRFLEELAISCRADWASIADLPGGIRIANIEHLQLIPTDHIMQSLTEEEHVRLVGVWQENATMWLPRVQFMFVQEADDWEEGFVNVLCPNETATGSSDELCTEDGDGSRDAVVV